MRTPQALDMADFIPGWQLFRDRVDAGTHLANRLAVYRGTDALVLGIARGGVPVAAAIARHLGAELDVVVARKLGAPSQPELALGAVTADGGRFLNEDVVEALGVSAAYLEAVTRAEMAEAGRREQRFRGNRPAPRIQGRTVILVDDGLATGATVRAALRSVRGGDPARVVVAVPVGAASTCDALRAEADDVVVLHTPEPFLAVGLYYRDFAATPDAEVERLLAAAGSSGEKPPT